MCDDYYLEMELPFTARVQALGRVAIPKEIREALMIVEGDLVSVRVRKVTSQKRAAQKSR